MSTKTSFERWVSNDNIPSCVNCKEKMEPQPPFYWGCRHCLPRCPLTEKQLGKYKKIVGNYGKIYAVGGVIAMSNEFGLMGKNVVMIYAQYIFNNKSGLWRVIGQVLQHSPEN